MWPLTLFLTVLAASLWVRVLNIRYRQWYARELPQEPIPSLLSKALAQLLGVAGGIYLVLVMGVAFLKLQLPAEMRFLGLAMEPLAFVSLVLALLQPFFERLWLRQG